MVPFTLCYTLTRRQRLGELFPWLPAIAGSTGFGVGVAYLVVFVSPWFSLFLALPFVAYPSLVALLVELAFRPGKAVEITVTETELALTVGGTRRVLTLAGVIQVFRDSSDWTVLHRDGTSLLIPAGAIRPEQLDFLKSFALRALAERKAGWNETAAG